MVPGNFDWFLHTMLFYHTRNFLKKQNRKRENEDNDDGESDNDDDEFNINTEVDVLANYQIVVLVNSNIHVNEFWFPNWRMVTEVFNLSTPSNYE